MVSQTYLFLPCKTTFRKHPLARGAYYPIGLVQGHAMNSFKGSCEQAPSKDLPQNQPQRSLHQPRHPQCCLSQVPG